MRTAVEPNWQRMTHIQKNISRLQRRLGRTQENICTRSAAQRTLILLPEQEESSRKMIIQPRTLRLPIYRQSPGTLESNINPTGSSKKHEQLLPDDRFPKRNASPGTLTTPASQKTPDSSRPKRRNPSGTRNHGRDDHLAHCCEAALSENRKRNRAIVP